MAERRFPPPWTAEVTPNCFIVRDADGQQLAYIYYESEPGRRSAAKLLSKDAPGLARIRNALAPNNKTSQELIATYGFGWRATTDQIWQID